MGGYGGGRVVDGKQEQGQWTGVFSGKNAPPPADFQGAAQEQSQGSQVNMSGPNSTQQWTTGPDGQPMLTSTLAGPLAGANAGLQQQVAGNVGMAPSGMQARQQAIDAAYGQATSRLDPQWQQREEMARTQLLNQGLDPSSEAGQNAMRDLNFARNDAYGGAMNSAILQGNDAGNAIFNQGMQSQQLPYQQMAMLQALQGQQFGAASGGYQGPQALAAAIAQSNRDLAWQQQQNQQQADTIGGVANAAGSLAFLSDERAKMNIHREATEALPGVPFATWEYRHAPGARHRGVIAQDLERVAPQYVSVRSDGMRMVDYSFLEGRTDGDDS